MIPIFTHLLFSDPAILTKPATVLEEQTGSFDSGNHNDYDDDYEEHE